MIRLVPTAPPMAIIETEEGRRREGQSDQLRDVPAREGRPRTVSRLCGRGERDQPAGGEAYPEEDGRTEASVGLLLVVLEALVLDRAAFLVDDLALLDGEGCVDLLVLLVVAVVGHAVQGKGWMGGGVRVKEQGARRAGMCL